MKENNLSFLGPKKGSAILLAINQFSVGKIKKFLRQNQKENILVVASDSVISHLLNKAGIKSLTVNEIFPSLKYEPLRDQANNLVFLNFQRVLEDKSINNEIKDFFDCLKFNLVDPLSQIYFYHFFWQDFLAEIQPKKVYLFDYPDLISAVLKMALASNQYRFELLRLSFFDKIKDFLGHNLPYFGLEPKYYRPYLRRFGLGPIFNLIENHRQNFGQSEAHRDILVGHFSSLTEIKEFTPLLKDLKKKNYSPLITLHKRLFRWYYLPFKKFGLPYIFLGQRQKFNITSLIDKAKNDLSLIYRQLAFGFNNAPKFDDQFLPQFLNLTNHLGEFFGYYQEITELIRQNKAKFFLSVNELQFLSRIHLLAAQKNGLKTIGLSITMDQLHWATIFEKITLVEKIKNLAMSDYLLVMGDEIKEVYAKLDCQHNFEIIVGGSIILQNLFEKRRILAPKTEAIKKSIFKQLSLPPHARLIIFTTQQYHYSFAYVKLISKVIDKLSEQEDFSDVYLLVKVHPLEFVLIYRLFGRYKKNRRVIFKKRVNLYEAILASEFLVTNFSFTAAEALLWQKPIMYLRFLPFPARFDILNSSLVAKVFSAAGLTEVIAEALNKSRFNQPALENLDLYFKNFNNAVDKHAEICQKIFDNKKEVKF